MSGSLHGSIHETVLLGVFAGTTCYSPDKLVATYLLPSSILIPLTQAKMFIL